MPLVGCSSLVPFLVSPPRSVSACLPCMPFVSHRLIGSPSVRLIRSPTGSLLASSARLSRRLIGSHLASYRLAPPSHPTSGAGRNHNRRRASRRVNGGGCLLSSDGGGRSSATDGNGRRAVIVGEWRTAADHGCLLVLGAMGGAARSSLLPISSAHQIGYGSPGSSNRLGSRVIPSTGRWLSFPFRPTPSRLLFSVCLPGLVPPSPAGGCAGCGMACGGGRAGCLRAFSSPVPLSRCRSFARCYTPRVARAVVPTRGVVGHFMGYFCRLLVGVGVFKYMPLNRILWLLMGICGDVVCCPFSALPVASFSPLCPAFRPFPVAVSWRRCGRFPAVSWGKRRVCVLSYSWPFSASRVMWRMASGDGLPYRADGVGGLSCLPLPVRASPAPWGGGLYAACGVLFSFAVRGSGVSSRFSLSRCSSSCHLIISVVIAFRSACFVAPPRYHLPRAPCVLSSPISAPCASFSSSLPLLCLFLLPPCSRVVSYRFSPRSFDEPGGAFFACLPRSLRLLSRRPVFLTRFARAPCLLALRVIVLRRPRFRSSSPSPLLVSRRVPVCRLSPFFDKRGRGGCRVVLACLSRRFALVLGCGSPVVRACGLSSAADGVRLGRWRGSLLALGWRRAMWCRLWLCSVCGWRVCIYEFGACSCIMIVVERKRLRRDFRR